MKIQSERTSWLPVFLYSVRCSKRIYCTRLQRGSTVDGDCGECVWWTRASQAVCDVVCARSVHVSTISVDWTLSTKYFYALYVQDQMNSLTTSTTATATSDQLTSTITITRANEKTSRMHAKHTVHRRSTVTHSGSQTREKYPNCREIIVVVGLLFYFVLHFTSSSSSYCHHHRFTYSVFRIRIHAS